MKGISLNIGRTFFVAMFFVLATGVSAQSLRTGFLMDAGTYRFRLNPAYQNKAGHVAIPMLGNVSVNMFGNVGVGNFIYDSPVNSDELVTFMHSSVDANEFLGDLESENVMRADFDFTVASVAFKAFGGFNTIDVSLRSNMGISAPYDLFRFMKQAGNDSYSFDDTKMISRNFVDVSIGHSRKIGENLTVGARAKFLFGLAYANVEFDNMSIVTSDSRWEIAAKGEAEIACGGNWEYSDEKTISGKTVVDGYDDASAGMNGFGIGVDLGDTYDFSDIGLTVSASVTDLGYISWSNAARAGISPEDRYVFEGFKNSEKFNDMAIHRPADGSQSATLDDQWSGLRDDLEDFFALEDKGEGSVSSGIGAKLNLAADYTLPFYKKMSAGVIYTHCFDDVYSYNLASLVLNYTPNSVFDFAVSGSVSDFGAGFGAMANVHFPGFNFFVGTDCFLNKVNKQYLPIEDMNANVSFGVNILLGKAR